ncbi:MAG: hypothetical protein KIS63_01405 [Caldilineales bacterium]|nr:hypothetical protein [Caldilineales bacterium]
MAPTDWVSVYGPEAAALLTVKTSAKLAARVGSSRKGVTDDGWSVSAAG